MIIKININTKKKTIINIIMKLTINKIIKKKN